MSKDDSFFPPTTSLRIISPSSANGSKESLHGSSSPSENFSNYETGYPLLSPWRTPLISIPDPSQIQSPTSKEKNAAAPSLQSDTQQFSTQHNNHAKWGRVCNKVNYPAEPTNSAQSTPAKSHRFSSVGGRSSFSKSRGVLQQIANAETAVDVPHFELVQDPSFWKDHNVQVLIRIRPLNNIEKVSQGYGRCLRQENAKTLVWLGHPETRFTFDHIACETISQENLFAVAGLPMVENCMSGYNSCMFAYGQTGSGKTYTMMGDIGHTIQSGNLNEDYGITPRIFEHLFSRIREEEYKGRNEGLKYSCKCSFLEIYNEQITDLLEPSSNNLQLREDSKKGVYVENLTEYNVCTVDDVLKLLLQGSANRKMAATYMNSESSRSHSVFTCVIESCWEKDSMTHLRFGRLNLVDLAGSERQKSSGAEGDRLKEAANINRSLSTLGLVIMSLVDLAQGRHRHVPYRDSRLTFLLQDSLGGNSKTTIIANISPSLCSANETLSTLKFAQRAKLIQNNAKVNEDASGDVMALQQQIQELKVKVAHRRDDSIAELVPDIPSEGGSNDIQKELIHARSLIEAMETKQITLIKELELLQKENYNLRELLLQDQAKRNKLSENHTSELVLQSKLEKLSQDLTMAQLLNSKYQEDHAMELLQNQQNQLVQAEVEMETTKTILHLQNEIALLHSELQGRLRLLEVENGSLRNCLAAKESELDTLCSDWERATIELTTFLLDGSKSLKDASSQVETITSLFPCDNIQISEQVERIAKLCIDKDESILLLKSSLEDAQRTVLEMEQKLNSLRGATIALTEVQKKKIGYERHAGDNFSEQGGDPNKQGSMVLGEHVDNSPLADENADIELACLELLEAILCHPEAESLFVSVRSIVPETISSSYGSVHDLVNGIHEIRKRFLNLKANYGSFFQCQTARNNPLVHSCRFFRGEENEELALDQIRDELKKVNERLDSMIMYISGVTKVNAGESDGWTSDFSTSSYDSSIDIAARSQQLVSFASDGKTVDQEFAESSFHSSEYQKVEHSQMPIQNMSSDGTLLCYLREEFREMCNAFGKINAQFTAISHSKCVSNGNNIIDKNHGVMQITNGHRDIKADSFFTKFEEVQGTMEEADCMLNTLLQSNEDAKKLSSIWNQANSDLALQKSNLIGEITQQSSSIYMQEDSNELLQDQMHFMLKEIATLMSLLDSSFQQYVEDLCNTTYSDAILTVKETLNNISSLRSRVEDISSLVKENGIVYFLPNRYYLRESNEVSQLDRNLDVLVSSLDVEEEVAVLHSESREKGAEVAKEECWIEKCGRSAAKPKDGVVHDDMIMENLKLKRALEHKEALLKGLLFDFSLLQESTSRRKDAKDDAVKMYVTLIQVQKELKMKTDELDNVRTQCAMLEGCLTETEKSLSATNFDLEQVRGELDVLSDRNAELRKLVKDLYQKKSEAEQQLQEQTDTIKDLANEILRMASSAEESLALSVKDIKDDVARVTMERDSLLDQLQALKDKLDFVYALTDEKDAIISEARQESGASKEYAEQKEEEVKILERSVEELESTINVLEKKVYEMEKEVERHREIKISSEVELRDMRERLLMVENMTENIDSHSSSGELFENKTLRKLHEVSMELCKAHNQINILEKEKEKLVKEIKQYQEYVTELIMHAEAQASQYQRKYKNLELMVNEVTTDSFKVVTGAAMTEKLEKTSAKSRGSSSPFRCISNLVQHMNLEKDQELSAAKLRIEELEALVGSKQKDVCLLNTRLASVESMTHDVIRDLLGVKLDITNYSDLISENQLQKLVEDALQQAQQHKAMAKEILKLQMQISDLVEEKESCILEVNRREADLLATRVTLEQIRERDQLLIAQNEMLKADKTNLQRKVAELDDMVKKLFGTTRSFELPEMQESQHNMTRRRDSSLGRNRTK
ncbi:OLC1v1020726C1 [Oldenlandia corymbosa var. corymbosa]|uniref:OLC1v1020726C1 n=1 Tax=Oldenlandia corymbosa var. corymbosa TaxID=529605 RepID=A0AAV1EHJ2_OLDCO|nr:OLC1v1020726C1 [Oldenlandia corymbosa var. corymbosa]